jgi:hypothetical protein
MSQAANAQDAKYKAVYRDANFFTNWNTQEMAQVVADYFASKGYEVLDEPKLRPWLDARIKDHESSILINSHDTLPNSALDPVGDAQAPSPNNPVRRYLLAGGRILNYGDIPFYIHADGANRADAGWQDGGGTVILGRSTNSGTWDVNAAPTITDDGKAWGLTQSTNSTRPDKPSDVDVVLSVDKNGNACSWVQRYTNMPGRGLFIRLFDVNLATVDALTPALLDDMKRVAEYNEPGTVLTALGTGIEGTVTAIDGKPLVGSNIFVKDADGKALWASTDSAGHYFAFVKPGSYTVTVPADGEQDQGAAPVPIAAGNVVKLDIKMKPLPSMSLATADLTGGAAWHILRAGTIYDFSPAAPDFKETADWETVDAPSDAKVEALNGAYYWYRLKLTVPADWATSKRGLTVDNFTIEDSDWTFFNGHFVGNMKWDGAVRSYYIAPEWVNFGGDNYLVIKGQHGNATGGMTGKAPVLHVAKDALGAVLVSAKQTGTGIPAQSATVGLTNAAGKEIATGVVREAGYVMFQQVPAGSYTVTLKTGPAIANAAPLTSPVTVEASKVAEVTLASQTITLLKGDATAYDDDFSGATLNSKWTSVEIGDAGGSSAKVANGHLVISAAGSNIYTTVDNCHFVYQKVKGDFSATVKVVSVPALAVLSKAALDIRAGTETDAINALIYQSPTEAQQYGVRFQYRPTKGGDTAGGAIFFDQPGTVAPCWLNLRRVGKTVTSYFSQNGTAALLPDTATSVEMANLPDEVMVGLAWASRGEMGDAVFDDFTLRTLTTTPAATPGDVTGDGKFNITDVVAGLRGVAGLATLTDAQKSVADVNKDGKFNIADVVLMLRVLAGLTTFP